MNSEEAFQPFKTLEERVKEIAASLGLTVERFNICITEPAFFQIAFSVQPDAVLTQEEKEKRKVDEEFAKIEKQFQEDLLQNKRLPSVEEEVKDWLKDW